MGAFVFVHGAGHGAWCWEQVVERLRSSGHHAVAEDLAGMGSDSTPARDVSLDRWGSDVADVVTAADHGDGVILVGHSLGGFPISLAAETVPASVRALVYVTAAVPRSGDTIRGWAEQLPMSHDEKVRSARVLADDGLSATFDRGSGIREVFYHLCAPDVARLAVARLGWTPLAPFATPTVLTQENFGRVPKVYIETTQDLAFSLELQRKAQGAHPMTTVYSLDADHSPFFSRADELVDVLLTVEGSRRR